MRPQSAHPGNKDSEGLSDKKLLKRQGSPTQTAMRSSFYSMSLLNDEERQEYLETEQGITEKFNEE